MTRKEIIEAVKVRLNELSAFDDINEMPELAYVDRMLDDSTGALFRVLPYNKLPLTNLDTVGLTDAGYGVYWLSLGVDYIKFGECRFASWKRSVRRVATAAEQVLQSSDITMGKPSRPVVVEHWGDAGAELWFYSVPDGDLRKRLSVVNFVKPEGCPNDLIDGIAWQCASDVLMSMGMVDASRRAIERLSVYGV